MIVVVLAKLGTPQKLGEYAWGLAVSAPIVLFANFQLRSLLASDVMERFRFAQYLTFRLVSLAVALGIVAFVAEVGSSGEKASVVILVGAAQAVELVSETFYGLMQKQDRMDRISRSLMYRGALSLAAMWITMYFTRSVVWALVALILGRLFVLFSWDTSFEPVKSELGVSTPRKQRLDARSFSNGASSGRDLNAGLFEREYNSLFCGGSPWQRGTRHVFRRGVPIERRDSGGFRVWSGIVSSGREGLR